MYANLLIVAKLHIFPDEIPIQMIYTLLPLGPISKGKLRVKYQSPKGVAFRLTGTLNMNTHMRSRESDILSIIFRNLAQRSKPLGSA